MQPDWLIVAPPHPASLSEEELWKDVAWDRIRTRGPGGQHRNKVETGVVLVHIPTRVRSEATERRSQGENRVRAVWRLRIALAVEVRTDTEEEFVASVLWRSRVDAQGRIACSPTHRDFPALLAESLDLVARYGFDMKASAERLLCTMSQLLKFVQLEPDAIAWVNAQRQARGMRPLR
jgi:hypothetical protein